MFKLKFLGIASVLLIGSSLAKAQTVQGRSFITGFEMGSLAEGYATGGEVQSAIVRSGAFAYRAKPVNSNQYVAFSSRQSGGVLRQIFRSSRFYIRVAQLPAAGSVSIVKLGGGATWNPEVDLNADGTLTLADSVSTMIARSTQALSADGAWHRVEFDVGYGLGVYVDGALWARGGGKAYPGAVAISFGAGQTPTSINATADLCFDDIVVDGDSFAVTGFPGDGRVLLVRPRLDPLNLNSWVNGVGATANLWAATDHAPPAGKAPKNALSTSQIKNSAHGTNLDYRPSFQTYSEAGVPLNATIQAVMALSNDGQETARNPRSGNLWLDANPAQAAGGYSFDFGDGIAAIGAFPQGWTSHAGPVTAGAFVNVNTSPIVVVRVAGSGSTTVDVDWLGVYVDYR